MATHDVVGLAAVGCACTTAGTGAVSAASVPSRSSRSRGAAPDVADGWPSTSPEEAGGRLSRWTAWLIPWSKRPTGHTQQQTSRDAIKMAQGLDLSLNLPLARVQSTHIRPHALCHTARAAFAPSAHPSPPCPYLAIKTPQPSTRRTANHPQPLVGASPDAMASAPLSAPPLPSRAPSFRATPDCSKLAMPSRPHRPIIALSSSHGEPARTARQHTHAYTLENTPRATHKAWSTSVLP